MLSGQFTSLARVGEIVFFSLQITNNSPSVTVRSIDLLANGPWDKYTVLSVSDGGSIEQGVFGITTFTAGMTISPGKIGTIRIAVSPNEPGNHVFKFAVISVRTADGTEVEPVGDGIAASVRVTR
jgi:hypothetical protein